ncbi:MAG: hypothetical protein Q9173_001261 [Seirophora scorigena]
MPLHVTRFTPSLSPSPSSPSDDPTLHDDRGVSEPLSEFESASLDYSISSLNQEYDYQRQLISHYSNARGSPALPGHPREQKSNAHHTGQHFPPDPSYSYGKRRQRLPPPPPSYSGMDAGAASEKGYPQNAYAYQYEYPRRPLVDLISNQWRATSSSTPYSPTSSVAPSFFQIISAPKVRRYLLIIILMVLLPWTSWTWYGRSRWEEHRLLNNALSKKIRTGAAWYGLNLPPAFPDMTQLERLDVGELPQEDGNRRLIFIGDVHGCYEECQSCPFPEPAGFLLQVDSNAVSLVQALIAETKYNSRTDHIVFAGDLISKGPDSSQVVDFAINNSASCVRGNHEDRILLAHRDLEVHRVSLPGPDEDNDDEGSKRSLGDPELDHLDEESFSHGDYFDCKLAKSLTSEQVSYLVACPLILELGDLPTLGRSIVVHAGLVPGVQLENQDPVGVMNMRTVDLKTHVPSRSNSGTPWFKLWNKHQSFLPPQNRSTVIYAHNSRRGLQLNQYSKGLDSGCASGGKLTAFILAINGTSKANSDVVSVKCKNKEGKKGKGRGWGDLAFLANKEDKS